MSSKARNEEKRREYEAKEIQRGIERQEHLDKQENCAHYRCTVIRFSWKGKPVEVFCEDCEATNYIEENE